MKYTWHLAFLWLNSFPQLPIFWGHRDGYIVTAVNTMNYPAGGVVSMCSHGVWFFLILKPMPYLILEINLLSVLYCTYTEHLLSMMGTI